MKKRVFVFDEANVDKMNLYCKVDLKKEYSHIRGYHGCCPLCLDSYYVNGIVPINKSRTLKHALYLLRDDAISQDKIVKVFNFHWSNLMESQKYVWLTLAKKELIDSCGHYLIYGSEFICSMAAELGCQESLKKGIPTIFHCDVPIEKIPSGYLVDLNERIQTGDGYNCGFKVIGAISKDEIVKCEHPRKILDPLNGYIPYYYRQNAVE
jgi:hypothetical protein